MDVVGTLARPLNIHGQHMDVHWTSIWCACAA